MKLIKCNACGGNVADNATRCPKCGGAVGPTKAKMRAAAIAAIVAGLLCLWISTYGIAGENWFWPKAGWTLLILSTALLAISFCSDMK